jgi:hypothetical protein
MPVPPQLPGQQEAFVKLHRANLEVTAAHAAIVAGTPPDCADPVECTTTGACLYLECSHRAAMSRLLRARAQRRAATDAVSAIVGSSSKP